MHIPITIKWAGNKPFEVEVDTEETGHTLKYQIYSLTGVETERQKILVKGGPLKDDASLATLGFKPGMSLMMMGSAAALPSKVAQPKFVEDMDSAELARQTQSPPGLENLGNTCYMNSTLQLLRKVPELQEELGSYSGGNLTGSLRDLYKNMGKTSEPIHPVMFLSSLRQAFPQFAERSRSGMGYAQQDAEECWSQIIHTLRQNLKPAEGEQVQSALDRFMGGKLQVSMTCDESDEAPVESTEDFIKLNCHISGTTNFMLDGIKDGLTDKLEKHSTTLDRNAQYTKKASVSRLPKYLSVNFVRFFFKTGVQKKAKILRKVGFPFDLDATPLCTEALQETMAPIRDRVREVQKQEEDAERARKRAKTMELETEVKAEAPVDLQKEVDGMLTEEMKQDPGANHCGLYELVGVLTHSGASADSGHYQAWMKGDTEDDWYRFNDDKVTVVTRDKIETLPGGGEADAIYIALYKAKF